MDTRDRNSPPRDGKEGGHTTEHAEFISKGPGSRHPLPEKREAVYESNWAFISFKPHESNTDSFLVTELVSALASVSLTASETLLGGRRLSLCRERCCEQERRLPASRLTDAGLKGWRYVHTHWRGST